MPLNLYAQHKFYKKNENIDKDNSFKFNFKKGKNL